MIKSILSTLIVCTLSLSIWSQNNNSTWQVIVLGMAQDAGYPQAGCSKSCCKAYWDGTNKKQHATCIGLLNVSTKQAWLFEATPDIKDQIYALDTLGYELVGIFLSHAHIGHYAGLMHLGREVMGTKNMPVFAMPKMKSFLEVNGPWSQLVQLNNISIQELKNEKTLELNEGVKITPFLVPHRDEYSETVGYQIEGPNHSLMFIPDINKWETWNKKLEEAIKMVNYALLDASFFSDGELPGRDMSKIPHPFTLETMELLKDLPTAEKSKVHFIHFNHTNPALFESKERQSVLTNGFNIALEGKIIQL